MKKQDFEIKEVDGKTVLIDKEIRVVDNQDIQNEIRSIISRQSNILKSTKNLKSEYDNLENKKNALKELINEEVISEDIFDITK